MNFVDFNARAGVCSFKKYIFQRGDLNGRDISQEESSLSKNNDGDFNARVVALHERSLISIQLKGKTKILSTLKLVDDKRRTDKTDFQSIGDNFVN